MTDAITDAHCIESFTVAWGICARSLIKTSGIDTWANSITSFEGNFFGLCLRIGCFDRVWALNRINEDLLVGQYFLHCRVRKSR